MGVSGTEALEGESSVFRIVCSWRPAPLETVDESARFNNRLVQLTLLESYTGCGHERESASNDLRLLCETDQFPESRASD